MALLIGQPLIGRELEQETSRWGPARFASMCDALVWAVSGRRCPGLPSFTARVNAQDGGIDTEWSVELPENSFSALTPILGPGWNVFQYKKRDLIAQKAWWFFFLLGEQDEEQILREQVELLGQRAEGVQALSAYWGRWGKRDPGAAEARLEELAKSSEVRGDAIVLTTVNFGPNQRAVERVTIQILFFSFTFRGA